MSNPMIGKLFSLIVIGLGLGGVVVASIKGLRPAEGTIEFASKGWPLHVGLAGKGQAFFDVRLEVVGELPTSDDEIAELRATITANKDCPDLVRIAWELPQESHFLDGRHLSEHPPLKAGESMEVVVKVGGFSREARRLASVKAFVEVEGNSLGSSAVITSLPEDSYEILHAASGVNIETAPPKERVLRGKIIR